MSISKAFDKTVAYYDDWIKNALPCYNEIFSVAKESIPYTPDERINVLDLGAGTGLFSWQVFAIFKEAKFVLMDVSEKMLNVAKERFSATSANVELVVQDYAKGLVAGEYDLVISSVSIHHLSDQEKKVLFARIYSALKPAGVFINIDQIKGSSKFFQEYYWNDWLKKIRTAGVEEEKIQESIKRRKKYDKESTLADQLNWLKEVGFLEVDCLYKYYCMALFWAKK
jgi:tRNA (cmo5U34)-methyltransferase